MIVAEVIVGIVDSIIKTRKLDRWARLLLSVGLSAFVTFLGAFGAAGLTHLALGHTPLLSAAYALFESCTTTAAMAWWVLRKSDLTKGMMFAAPSSVTDKLKDIMEEGITSTPTK